MLKRIVADINHALASLPTTDKILFHGKELDLNLINFQPILSNPSLEKQASIAFVDGGQAEILAAGNFCLSFIRVVAQIWKDNAKAVRKYEFYAFTHSCPNRSEVKSDDISKSNGISKSDIIYHTILYPLQDKNLITNLIDAEDLTISSTDATLRVGIERAPISRVAQMARRFAELALAGEMQSEVDFVILDGNLDQSFAGEEKYLAKLSSQVCALAKTSSLFTANGNNPTVLLSSLAPVGCWSYSLADKTHFVKLHPAAQHIFRFDGDVAVLPFLMHNSTDAVFLGYPYGLMLVDKLARVSNEEKTALIAQARMYLGGDVLKYLSTADAHQILDKVSY